jgi:hypothetical protein
VRVERERLDAQLLEDGDSRGRHALREHDEGVGPGAPRGECHGGGPGERWIEALVRRREMGPGREAQEVGVAASRGKRLVSLGARLEPRRLGQGDPVSRISGQTFTGAAELVLRDRRGQGGPRNQHGPERRFRRRGVGAGHREGAAGFLDG